MSPNAAEIFAQVNAATLIALVVEGKAIAKLPTDGRSARRAASHSMAMIFAMVAIFLSLSSVSEDRALDRSASTVLGGLTCLSLLILLDAAIGDLRAHRVTMRPWLLIVWPIQLGLLAWFVYWSAHFFSYSVFLTLIEDLKKLHLFRGA